jgi:hypothetical protein
MPSQLMLLHQLLLRQPLLLLQLKRLRSNSWQSKKNPALRGFFSPFGKGLCLGFVFGVCLWGLSLGLMYRECVDGLNLEGLNHEAPKKVFVI